MKVYQASRRGDLLCDPSTLLAYVSICCIASANVGLSLLQSAAPRGHFKCENGPLHHLLLLGFRTTILGNLVGGRRLGQSRGLISTPLKSILSAVLKASGKSWCQISSSAPTNHASTAAQHTDPKCSAEVEHRPGIYRQCMFDKVACMQKSRSRITDSPSQ